ncbi:MAG TPA: SGNH/GDSL hydrolase family protein [Pseudobdellovibrionaceae bacterium]|nr:SGNH/GDSL hydrolase family protein [Pseudobdellovibrionaceae bacterium]
MPAHDSKAPLRLHLFGDSLMRGDLGDDWWLRLPTTKMHVQNYARNGETFASLHKLILADHSSKSPRFHGDLALISCGTNDALAQTSNLVALAYDLYWGTQARSQSSLSHALEIAQQLRTRYARVGLLLPPPPHSSQLGNPFSKCLQRIRADLHQAHLPLEILEATPPEDEPLTQFPPALAAITRAFIRKRILAEPTGANFWHDGVHLGRRGGDSFLQLSLAFIQSPTHNIGDTTGLKSDSQRTP